MLWLTSIEQKLKEFSALGFSIIYLIIARYETCNEKLSPEPTEVQATSYYVSQIPGQQLLDRGDHFV